MDPEEGPADPRVPAVAPASAHNPMLLQQMEQEHQEACQRYQAEIDDLKSQKEFFDSKMQVPWLGLVRVLGIKPTPKHQLTN